MRCSDCNPSMRSQDIIWKKVLHGIRQRLNAEPMGSGTFLVVETLVLRKAPQLWSPVAANKSPIRERYTVLGPRVTIKVA